MTTAYPAPRRVELRLLDTDRLTLLEYARALAAAGVRDRDVAPLLRAAFQVTRDAPPAEFARGMTLAYAIVWQLERRADPGVTWEQAQSWDVEPIPPTPADHEAARISREADELVARVALGAGLAPADAGALTMSQVGGIGAAHAAREGAPRRRGARVHR